MNKIVITGANRGIGLELCRHYAKAQQQVVALVRKTSDELEQIGVRVVDGVDVSLGEGIARAQEALAGSSINLLIHNAGILRPSDFSSLNESLDPIREQFEVNALAPIRLTRALIDHLASGSKIVLITSRMGSIADNDSGGSYGYRMSKAALNAGAKSMSIDLAPRGIAVGLVHPGYVKTDMTGHSGLIEVTESARGIVARIDELNLENSGSFWHQNGEHLPW